jgi:hypothetical protein
LSDLDGAEERSTWAIRDVFAAINFEIAAIAPLIGYILF